MLIVDERNRAAERIAVRAMFEARKAVFIDLLKWDLPVLAGRYEVDQFDDGNATYLILTDLHQRHLASARLLPTSRPGILSSLFPTLCEGPPPSSADIYEITRFCLSPTLRAPERRFVRDQLVCGLTRFALDNGVRAYTGVAEAAWLRQILAFGWKCRPLGLPQRIDGRLIGAMRIEIDDDTLVRLADAGIAGAAAPHDAVAA